MTNKTLAIVGGGDLAQAISDRMSAEFDVKIYNHSYFDITDEDRVRDMARALADYNVVIVTAGEYSKNQWSMWMVNTVGPCCLISQLIEFARGQKIIAVSSYGAAWSSWPDIDSSRLTYNNSKLALNNFLLGLVQQNASDNQITVLQPSVFQSKMSNNKGAEVNHVVDQIANIIDNSLHIVQITVK
jgi:NAD(P)-dependent dehydrogenase (short-subunit alcohol dehydrogenase family)